MSAGGDNNKHAKAAEIAKLVGGAITALGGALVFVAAAGGALVWARFYAAELPADQALAVFPQRQLVAAGAVVLAVFLLLGALAAVGVFLISGRHEREEERKKEEVAGKEKAAADGDRKLSPDPASKLSADPASKQMSYGLLVLFVIEGLVVVALAADHSLERRVVAGEAVVLLALIAFMLREWQLWSRSRSPQGSTANQPSAPPEPTRRERIVDAARDLWGAVRGAPARARPPAEGGPSPPDAVRPPLWPYPLAVPAVGGLAAALATIGGSLYWLVLLGGAIAATVALRLVRGPDRYGRWGARRSPPLGVAALVAVGLAAAVPALILRELWVAISFAAAVALGLGCWRVDRLWSASPLWPALAVFVSVPLLGAVVGMARAIDDPQVQPMALIRDSDGPGQALQGIYVTETEDRVYFANVATYRCSEELVPDSGRLLWVPSDEVVAMALGPPQSVDDAGTTALEMYYALAPDAARAVPTATVAAAPSGEPKDGAEGEAELASRRLENPGPALRRDFHLEERPSPDSERAGESVTLKRRKDRAGDDATASDSKYRRTVRVNGLKAATFPSQRESGKWRRDEEGSGRWKSDGISFQVPEGATSGPVVIECGPPATPLHLRVKHRPTARIHVKPRRSGDILLDGARSTDQGGRIESWIWEVGGRSRAGSPRWRVSPAPGSGFRPVSLKLVDDEGDEDEATLGVWQTTEPQRALDGAALVRVVARKPTRARMDRRVVVHVHVRGGRRPLVRSQRLAAKVRQRVQEHAADDDGLSLARASGLGAKCLRKDGPSERLDLFLLGPDTRVVLPPGCRRKQDI